MAFDGPEGNIDLGEVDASDPNALLEALGATALDNPVMSARMENIHQSAGLHPISFPLVYQTGGLIAELKEALPEPAQIPTAKLSFNQHNPDTNPSVDTQLDVIFGGPKVG